MVSDLFPDAAALWRALALLPPRSAQLLVFRFVDGRSPAELVQLYGVEPEALEISLFRAATLLWEAGRTGRTLLPEDAPPLPSDEERRRARTLAAMLAGGREEEAVAPLARLLATLQANGPEVKRLAEQAAREELESPKARRADLLRRMALLALIGLAVWLYVRNGR